MNARSKIVRVFQAVSILILLIQGPFLATDVEAAQTMVIGTTIDSVVVLEMLKSLYGVSAEDASIQLMQSTESSLFGLFIVPASEGSDTGPSAHYFIATQENGQITITPEYSDTFTEQMQAFSKVDSANQELPDLLHVLTSGNGSSQLSLPWLTNTNATFTNGPHADGFQPAPNVLSALDFVPNDNKVRAARDGFAQQIICSGRTQSSWIWVTHGDGWRTSYYHVINAQVSTAGRSVARGEYLGDLAMTSADALRCGGSWTGPHVHTALLQNGTQVNVQGVDIGGWTIGGSGLGGTLTRVSDGAVRYASSANGDRTVYNDGTIGSGGTSCSNPSPNSDQIGLYTDDNYCGNYTILGAGQYSNPAALGIPNDSVSSIKVGASVIATLCKDDNYAGGCEDFTTDDPRLSDNGIGNDTVSSAKVVTWPGAVLPSDYGFCAEEGQRCTFSGSAEIYYGADGQFVGPRTYTDGVDCNNNVFGDPIPGTHKQCFIKGGRPQGSTFCANESGICSFGTGNIATIFYGVNGKYNSKTSVVSSIACNNDTFGDPFSGIGKACYYTITGSPVSKPSNPNPVDNTTYERNNNTILSWSTNGTSCDVHIWGGNIDISPSNNCSSLSLGEQRGGAYTWQVTASNASGTVAGPDWHFNIRPYPPTNLATSGLSSTQVTLNWTLSSDEPNDIDSYEIYQNDQLRGTVAKGISTYTATGLTCNESYSFYVRSKRQGVLSVQSNMVNPTTTACQTIPNTPLNFRVNGSTQTSITLGWDDVGNETGFKIYRWGHDGTQWTFIYLASVGANINSYTQNNLDCGSGFNYYEVSAYNANGESQHTSWIQGTTLPCAFSKVTPVDNGQNQPLSTTLTWGSSNGAASYEYCYDTTNDNVCTWINNGEATSVTLSGLSPATTYYWHVRAINAGGTTYANSSSTASWSFTTQSDQVECPATINNWKGEYWINPSLAGSPTVCRDDAEVNFDWGYGSPDPSISADNFSARWTRTIYFPAGTYHFYLGHDDGARLFIDDMENPVLDKWMTCCVVDPLDKVMTEGNHVIKVEYSENGGAANVHFWWEGGISTALGNPALNVAQRGGDNNGYELNPTNAYANDGVFAMDVNSGSGTSTSCTDKKKDGHVFYNYGVSLPGASTIQGIEILLDSKVDSTVGAPKLCIQLSWNGGASWTTVKSTGILSTTEQTYTLGSPTDTWGRAWTAADLSNANFRVRIIDVASNISRDFSLDAISVRVTYK